MSGNRVGQDGLASDPACRKTSLPIWTYEGPPGTRKAFRGIDFGYLETYDADDSDDDGDDEWL